MIRHIRFPLFFPFWVFLGSFVASLFFNFLSFFLLSLSLSFCLHLHHECRWGSTTITMPAPWPPPPPLSSSIFFSFSNCFLHISKSPTQTHRPNRKPYLGSSTTCPTGGGLCTLYIHWCKTKDTIDLLACSITVHWKTITPIQSNVRECQKFSKITSTYMLKLNECFNSRLKFNKPWLCPRFIELQPRV